jgi:serine/threonine-protein kinase
MLDWKEVWRVGVQVGRALHEASRHKVVHRNLTPANILRRKVDRACLVGDMMLAKALEGTLAVQITQPGQLIGDIPFMSPERTRGQDDIDTRSDIYGLGATMYALLTGRPPSEGGSLPELVQNVREKEPAKPKEYQLSVDDLFQDMVMKMLAKNPDDRYDSPDQLLRELNRIGKFNSLEADWSGWQD